MKLIYYKKLERPKLLSRKK